MRKQIIVLFLAALIGLCPTMNSIEAQSQTNKANRVAIVVGSNWQTCRNWKEWSENMKLGFTFGHAEGITQVLSFLSDDPASRTKIKDDFDSSYAVTFGELTKAVDEFCSDFRNVNIPVVNAMMLVCGSIAGFAAYDEKTMRVWRCVAAAGDDQNKIRDCSNQP